MVKGYPGLAIDIKLDRRKCFVGVMIFSMHLTL